MVEEIADVYGNILTENNNNNNNNIKYETSYKINRK